MFYNTNALRKELSDGLDAKVEGTVLVVPQAQGWEVCMCSSYVIFPVNKTTCLDCDQHTRHHAHHFSILPDLLYSSTTLPIPAQTTYTSLTMAIGIFTILAGLVALAAGYFYFFGISPEMKRKMEQQALKTMGENKMSYMAKGEFFHMPQGLPSPAYSVVYTTCSLGFY